MGAPNGGKLALRADQSFYLETVLSPLGPNGRIMTGNFEVPQEGALTPFIDEPQRKKSESALTGRFQSSQLLVNESG